MVAMRKDHRPSTLIFDSPVAYWRSVSKNHTSAKHGRRKLQWYEFLRAERARKLKAIEQLSTGKVRLSVRTDGELRDVSHEMVADHKRHIAEIEEILSAAGESTE
jgi:hypothetical protein